MRLLFGVAAPSFVAPSAAAAAAANAAAASPLATGATVGAFCGAACRSGTTALAKSRRTAVGGGPSSSSRRRAGCRARFRLTCFIVMHPAVRRHIEEAIPFLPKLKKIRVPGWRRNARNREKGSPVQADALRGRRNERKQSNGGVDTFGFSLFSELQAGGALELRIEAALTFETAG
jgi:hypothetical protein